MSQITKNKVRKAFDPDALRRICTMEEAEFASYGQRYDLKSEVSRSGVERKRFFYYQNNGSNILGVAHLDSVCETRRCDIMETAAGPVVYSPTLDDRLGAYVILELLPKLGITVDWLLTTGEEMGDSTAAYFNTKFQYNWCIEFDRGGTDVVMYQYETPELVEKVKDVGGHVGQGIFSDISVMDHLGISCFNWGVGYRDYHGPRAHAWLEDTFRMVARFGRFYEANKDTSLPYDDEYNFVQWDCLCGEPLNGDDLCLKCDADKVATKTWWESQEVES